MKILRAKKEDLKFLLNLYNFYILTNLFSSKKKINYSQHKKWFIQNCIELKKVFIYIVKIKNIKIGYIRLENIQKNIFEVSLALKPNQLGKGIGTKMLEKINKKFLPKKKIIFVSKIKKINPKSIMCFKNNKFKKFNLYRKFFYSLKNPSEYFFYKLIRVKTK